MDGVGKSNVLGGGIQLCGCDKNWVGEGSNDRRMWDVEWSTVGEVDWGGECLLSEVVKDAVGVRSILVVVLGLWRSMTGCGLWRGQPRYGALELESWGSWHSWNEYSVLSVGYYANGNDYNQISSVLQ